MTVPAPTVPAPTVPAPHADARRPDPGHPARRLARARSGVAAVEFALILPIMLTLFVGLTELSSAIDNWRKVTLVARTVSDLTAQGDKQDPFSQETMTDILAASKLILRPFDGSKATIVVSALGYDVKKSLARPTVCSSTATANAKARSLGVAADLSLPPGFAVPGMRYVLTEVSMPYAPMLGSAVVNRLGGFNGSFTLSVSFPWPTRGGQTHGTNPYPEIVLPGGSPC